MKILIHLTISLILLLPLLDYAQPKSKKVKNLFFCPQIKHINKDPVTLTWNAAGGWKSFDQSFAVKLKTFLGAQWSGARVGQIICLYQGANPSTFPVQLVFHTLTYSPQGGEWSKNLGGYKNCKSPTRGVTQTDCPFKMRLKPKRSNIIKEAESLKNTPPPTIPSF